ncbi:MAG: class I SAM-dependent methyltransferase [Bacteroidales bacterium]
MNHPWLSIPWQDYEQHMADPSVGQLQLLSRITKNLLDEYKPASLAILGIGTGNGLEHVSPEITPVVYGIDINPQYLEIVQQRYAAKMPGLQLITSDLNREDIPFDNADLVIAGLIFEYLDPQKAVEKIARCIGPSGIIASITQKTGKSTFVSPTKYESLKNLGAHHKDVDDNMLEQLFKQHGLTRIHRKQHPLQSGKLLIELLLRR